MTRAAAATDAREAIDIAIRSGDDVAAALRHAEPRVRVAVLRDVAADPERMARYGGGCGRDLVEELLLLCRETAGTADRTGYAYALLQVDDPRATAFAKDEFVHGDHAKLALVAAARLATLPADERVETLVPVVMGRHGPTRLRAAANLLADVADLPPAVALRVALLTDHPVTPPPVLASTLDVWLTALNGDRPAGARAALTSAGTPALVTLLSQWNRLPQSLRAWTLQWALTTLEGDGTVRSELGTQLSAALVDALTSSEDEELLGVSLRLAERLLPTDAVETPSELGRAVRSLDAHPASSVRALALRIGADAPDPLAVLDHEPDVTMRRSLIALLEDDSRPEALDRLAAGLHDDDWRIRATAATALGRQAHACLAGDDGTPRASRTALDILRATFAGQHENARIAAGRTLLELGDEAGLTTGIDAKGTSSARR